MKTALQGPVRVRFAPSPTGFLHVGGARTAIYNELLRRNLGGVLVLRIEDTDQKRSSAAMIDQITDALAWLGIEWDEGPVMQSGQVERHRRAADELLAAGKAYRCFETPEELAALRREAEQAGETFTYRTVRGPLPPDEEQARLAAGDPCAVRFRMPAGPVRFTDLVRGEVEFAPEVLDDFIILRSDRTPTYHLSVVCDDIDMAVTHVLRGEDHLSNTPKHIPLFEALGGSAPAFAHLPLILGPDKKRLSKRFGATSVEEFRDQGILPQALYNHLALLGWSPGGDLELMSRDRMSELFTVERLNAAAAVFDLDKLAWMNAQYLSSLPLDELMPHLAPFIEQVGLADAPADRLAAVVELNRSRGKELRELAGMALPYFAAELEYDPELCKKFLGQAELPGQVAELARRYGALPDFSEGPLEEALRGLADELEVKAGVLIHPTRMALTASKKGPSLFELVEVMGREATVRHMERFRGFLEENAAGG